MSVTKHGEKRIIERVGGGKKTSEKIADKALQFGITHSESTGRLNKYISKLYFDNKNGNNIRVYNRKVYIFNFETLITVLDLPKNLYGIEDKIKAKKQKSLPE